MSATLATSAHARAAYALVQELQSRLEGRLTLPADAGAFETHAWLRDGGRHGGGSRRTYAGGSVFQRASLNVSHVHYDDLPERALASASALSAIVHPAHPRAPSLHLHVSWTEMKTGTGSWRVMADLNPALPDAGDTARFRLALRQAGGGSYDDATQRGDRYFFVPALERHRGVAHFYLEQYQTGDVSADRAFATRFGELVIDAYGDVLRDALAGAAAPTPDEAARQLAYHTVYLFQVLTLDRGTTSGLLVHDENDLGILGSLPAAVDRALLASWEPKMTPPQDELLRTLVGIVPADGTIGDAEKNAFCGALRAHYARHPAALDLQARGDVVPSTVQNHARP